MKQFLVTYHAPASAIEQFKNATQEQIMEATKPWMTWRSNFETNVVNFGARLTSGEDRSIKSEWKSSESEVTGFSILQAESKDELKEILKNHPQLHWDENCRVSIYEFQTM